MLEEFVKTVFKNLIKTEFSHLELPSLMCAKIVKRKEISTFYQYNLKILDENNQVDNSFPEIPNIKSRFNFQVGDTVAISLLYGKLNPYIVGEVV